MSLHIINPAVYRKVADVELLRPIHDDEHYQRVLDVVKGLVLKTSPSVEELEYLDALTVFVEKYEQARFPTTQEPLSGLDLLKVLMEEHGMNGSDLGRLLGQRSLGGAILRSERELSKKHVKLLSEHFRVSAELFLS